ncbi:3-beta hydroxysteroid dehydrogenase [Dyadobacter beijingensis]|uniref:3-beta hydroxysteroid dehydrogenase n=1 Tax=Dyadobacter beijingensis TaxID=365489 RepID=A0ABQ2HU74_9BACT|nr:NAD(P)H-binding protein [Dyadobacter beijingensis]GGM91751.1 3-beta hydroxysteroid dehydrogenase [Dyadobacter beijingensis]
MKIALIGATGFVGTHVLTELVSRGHQVTAIARNTDKIDTGSELVTAKSVDVTDADAVAAAVAGHDAVISTFNPGWANPNIYDDFIAGAKAIQAGVKKGGVKRFLTVGGAGSLEIQPGLQLVDTPNFPAEYKPGATAARDYLNILRTETELDWTFLSPAIEMSPAHPGARTGKYRTSLDTPVFDEHHRSKLSVEDTAIAIADEIEQGNFIRKRFTAAY